MNTVQETFPYHDKGGLNSGQAHDIISKTRLTYYSPNLIEIELGNEFIRFRVEGPIAHVTMTRFAVRLTTLGEQFDFMRDLLPEIYKLFTEFGFRLYAK